MDEIYIGGHHSGKRGRGSENKCSVMVAVERDGTQLGRLRLAVIENCSAQEIQSFIKDHIAPKSSVVTDGWKGYNGLEELQYRHKKVMPANATDRASVLPGVHLVASLVKRLVLGTYQGRMEKKYLQNYLNEYVFRFNRRTSKSVGKCFYRIVQQSMQSMRITRKQIAEGSISLARTR